MVRTIQWIAGIAGLGALVLGLLFWIAQIDLLNIHMLLGLIVALALLVISILAVSTGGMRILGAIGIVYAIILPTFGVNQSGILIGNTHWLIETAHMLLGIGAIAFTGIMGTRYMRLKQQSTKAAAPQAGR